MSWKYVVPILIILYLITWVLTYGIYAIIAWGFKIKFSWKIAMITWIIWCILQSIFIIRVK
jgi:hypothetical protein